MKFWKFKKFVFFFIWKIIKYVEYSSNLKKNKIKYKFINKIIE